MLTNDVICIIKVIILISFVYVILFCFFPRYWKVEPLENDVDLTILYKAWSSDKVDPDMDLYRGKVNITEDKKECASWDTLVKDGKWPEYLNTEEKRKSNLGDKDGDHNFCRNPDNRNRPWCPLSDGTQAFCSKDDFEKEVTDNKCIEVDSWWKGVSSLKENTDDGLEGDDSDDNHDLESSKQVEEVSSWEKCRKKCFNSFEKLSVEEEIEEKIRQPNCMAFTTKLDSECLNNKKCKCYLFKDGEFNKEGDVGILSNDKEKQEAKEKMKDYVSFDNKCLTDKRLYSYTTDEIHPGFKRCICTAGKPAERDNCPGEGVHKCEICNAGYSKDKKNPNICVDDNPITREMVDKLISDNTPKDVQIQETTVLKGTERKQLNRYIPSCARCTEMDFNPSTIPHPDGVDCRAGGKGLVKEKEMSGIEEVQEVKEDIFQMIIQMKFQMIFQMIYRQFLTFICAVLSIGCDSAKEALDCPNKYK